MTYEPLQTYLNAIYKGTLVDTMPGPEPNLSFLERVIQKFQPKLIVQRVFNDLKASIETEKRNLGNNLLEDFMIEDLQENPRTEEVYARALEHFSKQGYSSYGFIGRGRLLKNQDGKRLEVTVYTGTRHLAARVNRVKRVNLRS